ncbi:outer membrane protein assembly factor BamE [Sulfurirhabdus autotrophica]|uniref:Outer membrane protein assembly factor BamE n=1 Tax=Sulfurirhabdus autotrophica TaxID=1706046 RepID=A0A4R3YFF3_9PROT|nr:outer membrane protein assembly factor BamE [Sulfurirhabdus autotrophica]TCV90840.1 outer membrane protein assembly factor BamE [Sulfurirhabdus autotrophica]
MYKIIIPLVLLLASCSYVPTISPYKIDIQQGNVVTQEMVSKLKPGMTKSQTKFVLGTPLITDAFHADRWDYVYLLKKGGKLLEQRKLTVVFEGDLLKRLEGDVAAATSEDTKAAENASAKPDEAQQNVKADQKNDGAKVEKEEKGFFGRMLEKIGL